MIIKYKVIVGNGVVITEGDMPVEVIDSCSIKFAVPIHCRRGENFQLSFPKEVLDKLGAGHLIECGHEEE